MVDEGSNSQGLTHESSAVLKHLDMMQGIINRMSVNSRSCKQWCVVLIAGIFALIAKQGSAEFAVLALFPLILFCFLDTYYLTLERRIVDANNAFLDKLNDGRLQTNELFKVKTEREKVISSLVKTSTSLAIWPFYSLIGVMVFSAWCLAN
jgi:hypothetical protein